MPARRGAAIKRSVAAHADEIARMVDQLGAHAVVFGTDMQGAGPEPVLAGYADLREVVKLLARRGWPDAALQQACIVNCARVLARAMHA